MENFFGSLKSDQTHHRRYRTRQKALREITDHIEVFYNRQRRQTRFGFPFPATYERQLVRQQRVA
jgi:transposase InsO family protein